MEKDSNLISLVVCSIDSEEVLNNHISHLITVSSRIVYNVEIVVILGRDTAPPTVNFLPKNVSLKVSSEKKCGVYHAFNTGVFMASGTYTYFANVGDRLNYLPKEILTTTDMLAFPVNICDENEVQLRVRRPEDPKYLVPHHQGIFLKTNVYKQFYFNAKYKSAADLDLLIKVSRLNLCTTFFNNVDPISMFTLGGISSSRNFYKIINRKFERFLIILRNGFILSWLKFMLARLST